MVFNFLRKIFLSSAIDKEKRNKKREENKIDCGVKSLEQMLDELEKRSEGDVEKLMNGLQIYFPPDQKYKVIWVDDIDCQHGFRCCERRFDDMIRDYADPLQVNVLKKNDIDWNEVNLEKMIEEGVYCIYNHHKNYGKDIPLAVFKITCI